MNNIINDNSINLDKLIPKHPKRKLIYEKFYNFLNTNINLKEFDYNQIDIQKMALNIERGIFNHAISIYNFSYPFEYWNDHFKFLYINRSVIIYNNLNPNSSLKNNTLLNRLLKKEFNEFEMCKFTPKQLFPERWDYLLKNCLDTVLTNTIQKPEDRPDGLFKCGKCKSYKTEYNEKQTRSAKNIGWKSTLLITFWLCYWENSCSPNKNTQVLVN